MSNAAEDVAMIPFRVFKTPMGKATCSIGLSSVCSCYFLGFKKLGQVGWCMLSNEVLERGGDGSGYLIPCKSCPFEKTRDAISKCAL